MKPPVYSLTDFKVRENSIGNARRRMREFERSARAKPGILQYHFLQDDEDPTVFTAFGIFATNRDLEVYRASMQEASQDDPKMSDVLDPERPPSMRRLARI